MKQIFTVLCLAISTATFAQVKIGGTGTPDPKAVLELDGGTNKGLLLPRLTKAQRLALSNVPAGLFVYQTDGAASEVGLYYSIPSLPNIPLWKYVNTGTDYWSHNLADVNSIGNTNTGNVGIGVELLSKPLMKLHVGSDVSDIAQFHNKSSLALNTKTGIYFSTGTSSGAQNDYYYTGALKTIGASATEARLGLFTQSNSTADDLLERLSVSNSGSVGIGDTIPSLAGLVVNKKTGSVNAMFGSNTSGISIESNNPAVAFNAYTDGGSKNIAGGYSARISHNPVNGLMRFYTTNASGTAGNLNDANMVARMTLGTNGNVGINTAFNPLMKLHVSSPDETIALFENLQPLDVNIKSGIYLRTGTRYTGAIKTTGTFDYTARMGLFTSSSGTPGGLEERLSITDEGNVGIGTTSPNLGGLVVNGKVGAVNAMFGSNTSGVAIESLFPGIGFNSYFSGNRKAINAGFGSLVGQDPISGRFYIQTSATSANGQAAAQNTIDRLNILPNGNIGVQGNTEPQSPLSFANALGEKINFYDVNATSNYGIGVQGAQLQLYTGGGGDAISFGYGSSANFTEKVKMQNGFMILNNGRIRFNGQYSAGNSSGIEFTKTGNNSASQSFIGMIDDNNLGFYGFPGAGWGLLFDVNDGAVKIGTTQKATGYKLNVGGKIIAEEVRVQLRSAWPDYVFSKKYNLRSLQEVEQYITANNHLPNVPAAADVEKSGIALGEMQTKMMEKIEELTLYVIELEKKLNKQALKMQTMKSK